MKKLLAVIPARGGSKGIPKKNIKKLLKRPLCDWVISSAIKSNLFDEIWVSTDDSEIAEESIKSGAKVHFRNKESAIDTAPTNLAILDFINNNNNNININKNTDLFLIQATSPFTMPQDFVKAYYIYLNNNSDGLITCINTHQFRWGKYNNKKGQPLNYNIYNRPRRQDWEGEYIEDGSFYIIKISEFIKSHGIPPNNNTSIYVMPYSRVLEIDEPIDFEIAEKLALNGLGYHPKYKNIIVLDIGGTFIRSAISINNKLLNIIQSDSENKDNILLDKIKQQIKEQLKYSKENKYKIEGIGISTGGIVDSENNTIKESINIDNWDNIKIPNKIKNIRIKIENDGNCSLLAEIEDKKLTKYNNIIGLIIGTGVGVGIKINNKIINNSECGKIFEELLKSSELDINKNNKSYMENIGLTFANELIKLTELLCVEKIIINGFINKYPLIINSLIINFKKNLRKFYKCDIIISHLNNQGLLGASLLF